MHLQIKRLMNNRHLLFTVLEVGKSEMKAPSDSESGESSHSGL